MPLPPKIDAMVRQRFEELEAEVEELRRTIIADREKQDRAAREGTGFDWDESTNVDQQFISFRTRFLSLLHLLLTCTPKTEPSGVRVSK